MWWNAPVPSLAVQVAVATAVVLAARVLLVLVSVHSSRRGRRRAGRFRSRPARTLAVLGSGGHTSEMIRLLSGLDAGRYRPLIYVVAETDATSLERVEVAAGEAKGGGGARMANVVYRIPRSREVGQSYATSVFTTLHSFLYAAWVVIRTRPDLVLCNGPGTCLPIAYCALVCRILGWCGGNVVFVESFCRVKSLSLTGRLLYPVADRFLVHWPELTDRYPESEVVSSFLQHNTTADDVSK